MSAHSVKSKARHPDTTTFPREAFEAGHVTFELCDHPDNGVTFALIAGEALSARDRRPLFAGHVPRGMATQLRKLAHRLDELEAIGNQINGLVCALHLDNHSGTLRDPCNPIAQAERALAQAWSHLYQELRKRANVERMMAGAGDFFAEHPWATKD